MGDGTAKRPAGRELRHSLGHPVERPGNRHELLLFGCEGYGCSVSGRFVGWFVVRKFGDVCAGVLWLKKSVRGLLCVRSSMCAHSDESCEWRRGILVECWFGSICALGKMR